MKFGGAYQQELIWIIRAACRKSYVRNLAYAILNKS